MQDRYDKWYPKVNPFNYGEVIRNAEVVSEKTTFTFKVPETTGELRAAAIYLGYRFDIPELSLSKPGSPMTSNYHWSTNETSSKGEMESH